MLGKYAKAVGTYVRSNLKFGKTGLKCINAQVSDDVSTTASTVAQEYSEPCMSPLPNCPEDQQDDILVYNVCRLAGLAGDESAFGHVWLVLRFLQACRYGMPDVRAILALALCNSRITQDLTAQMGTKEKLMVLTIHIYLAHTWLEDEDIILGDWHRHLFKKYCSFDALTDAVKKLWSLRDFRIAVPDAMFEEMQQQLLVVPN
mmetsp:Transcript_19362/g.42933  ORF Transcript_19362/g.42933 Transcript_19362/m.42933 type:complete len:203 (+) Transcript_19362:228-836(+)